MTSYNADLDQVRNGTNCATLLERLPPGWHLDRKGSTRRALKYRRGEGEIVIVNHDGRGWDPQSSAKGDIYPIVRLPATKRRARCPPTGSSLTDTFVFAEAHDGLADFDADFTLMTTDRELLVCHGYSCHVDIQ